MLPSHQPSQALTSRPTGIYQLHVSVASAHEARCFVYRNGRVVTTVRALTARGAVSVARRNVRNARKAGGL